MRTTFFWIFPVEVLGSSSTTITAFGALKVHHRGPSAQLARVDGFAGRGHHDGGDRLAPARVRQADHRDLEPRLGRVEAVSTSIEATFSPPVLMTSL